MSITPSLSYLPFELQALVVSFCDPATLAIACGVSFDFLEIASRPLYQHIEILSIKQVHLLFRDSDFAASSRVSPFLSLSLIQTVTITASRSSCSILRFPNGGRHKGRPLPISLLDFTPESWRSHSKVDSPLLLLFDPAKAVLSRPSSASTALEHYVSLNAPWTRTRAIIFDRVTPEIYLRDYAWLQKAVRDGDKPFQVEFWWAASDFDSDFGCKENTATDLDWLRNFDAVRAVVRLENLDMREQLRDELARQNELEGIDIDHLCRNISFQSY